MIDPKYYGFQPIEFENLEEILTNPTDQRLFAIASALYNHSYTVDRLHELTKIDKW
jgi:carbamoyl-phosphate synthase large subunit